MHFSLHGDNLSKRILDATSKTKTVLSIFVRKRNVLLCHLAFKKHWWLVRNWRIPCAILTNTSNILHRDLKPETVRFEAFGNVQLFDMDVAHIRIVPAALDKDQTFKILLYW